MHRLPLLNLAVILLGALSLAGAARAGNPAKMSGLQGPGWVESGPVAVRLIAERDGVDTASAVSLGIQVRLRKGWWTYWRAPGDAGMPPNFDWTGSQNLRYTPELFFPRPIQRTTFGHALRIYRDEVVFPLRVVAADPKKPVVLKLNFTLGVCKEVCVPIMANATLDLPSRKPGEAQAIPHHQAIIARYEAAVPRANPQRTGMQIKTVRVIRVQDSQTKSLAVDVLRANDIQRPLVVVEMAPGEPPMVAKSLGKPPVGQPWSFVVDLDPPNDRAHQWVGRRVRVTIMDGSKSLDQVWVVGAPSSASGHFGAPPTVRMSEENRGAGDAPWKPRD